MRALDVRPHLSGCGQARRKRDPIQVDQELLQTEVQFELQPIIPVDVYTLDHLPIIITWSDVLIIGASAMLLCFLATLYPARQASRLEPAEALRYE